MHLGYLGLMDYRRRGKPAHEVFREHIEQVIHAMEKLMGEIVPMVERELGPLATLGARLSAAAGVREAQA